MVGVEEVLHVFDVGGCWGLEFEDLGLLNECFVYCAYKIMFSDLGRRYIILLYSFNTVRILCATVHCLVSPSSEHWLNQYQFTAY